MCGISGIIGVSNSNVESELFKNAAHKTLTHRGPDNFGSYQHEDVLICHNRLKIIDLSDAANQPMHSKSGLSSIVYNGEVYNFKELAEEIGFSNLTSDTALILEYFELNGIEKTLRAINGMFAFTLVDWESKQVYLCRDRFGQKPLYYLNNSSLIFSSDIRLMKKLPSINLTLNKNAVDYYLSELSVPQPSTIWNEVLQVNPAHYITYSLENETIKEKEYWALNPSNNYSEVDEQKCLDQLSNILADSIKKRQLADVPVGYFLSGGVDSGLITAIAASESSDPINTYTVKFGESDFDESYDAKLISERYQTNHTEIIIEANIKADIENILEYFGEPFADSSAIPTYYISKKIKEHVTVAISGDGGDEMFGGYIDYGYSFQAERLLSAQPNKILREAKVSWSKIGSRISERVTNYGSAKEYLEIEEPMRLFRNMGYPPQSEYLKSHFKSIYDSTTEFSSMTDRLMISSLKTRLLNDYLVKVDRMSMSNSLEIRSPFLDYRLSEFAFSISPNLKFKGGHLKYLLKKLGEKYMYSDIFNRKKRGFGIPIKHWLKNELSSFAQDHLHSFDKRSLFDGKTEKLLTEHKNNLADHTHRIWAIICLEIWLQKNL